MKKYISGALAASVMLCCLISCGESVSGNPTEATAAGNATEAAESTGIYDVLQDNNYNGYEFRVLNNLSNVAYVNIGEKGLTGETLDDAMYNRNLRVAEKLNIKFNIENREYQDTYDTISKLVMSGDDVYDMYTLDLSWMRQHALNGYIFNTADIKSLDINNPWWDKNAIESVTVCGYYYALLGDLHVGYFDTFYPAVFNKNMVENLGLDDPYQLVRDGKWTLDMMIDMMMSVKQDLDGDGKWTENDRYPFSMYQDNASICLLSTSNVELFPRDENNLPVWKGLPERYVETYEKLADTMFSEKTNNANNCSGNVTKSDLAKHRAMMHIGETLFMFEPLGAVKDLRDVDFALGIAPLPKYDESQKDYRTYIFAAANAIAIPVTNPDPERTGVILEHMAAYSRETVRNVFFNETLDYKYAQDVEGQEMLDIMFSGGFFELGSVYGWGGVVKEMMNQLKEGKKEIASKIEAISDKAISDLETAVEAFNDLK